MSIIPTEENYNKVTTPSPTTTKDEFVRENWDLNESSGGKLELSILSFADEEYVERIEKLKEVDRFIENLKAKSTSEGFPPYNLVSEAEKLWMDLQSEFEDSIPIPLISLDFDGNILFTLSNNQHYIELEIVKAGIDFFYENEVTGETELKEIDFGMPLIDNIEQWLLKIASSI